MKFNSLIAFNRFECDYYCYHYYLRACQIVSGSTLLPFCYPHITGNAWAQDSEEDGTKEGKRGREKRGWEHGVGDRHREREGGRRGERDCCLLVA